MPNRYLREGILTSDRVNKLGAQAEIFYRRLMSLVDDYGRYEARPSLLRAAAFPLRVDKVREADVSRWLTEVESAGLIVLYSVNGKNYLELTGLGEPRAKSSKFPAPLSSANTCAQTQTNAPSAPSITITPSPISTEPQAASEQAIPSAVEFPSFPTTGNPRTWLLTDAHIAELSTTFPAVDVPSESRKAFGWVKANMGRRKTAKGMPRFLWSWMGRCQDRGGGSSAIPADQPRSKKYAS